MERYKRVMMRWDVRLCPAVGSEFVCVGAPDVGAAVEDVGVPHDYLALGDEDWLETVGPTAVREGCVGVGFTGVCGEGGI